MPSGRTHDSITLYGLPVIVAMTFERTRSGNLTLIVTGAYLFSGLMFGPDLDIHSQQYKRWGPLRWIWLPYRSVVRHRSLWSHGPIVGTVVRVGYLLLWLGSFGIVAILLGATVAQLIGATSDGRSLVQQWLDASAIELGKLFQQYAVEGLALGVGLELGALSHTLSDWIGSAYKRAKKRRTESQRLRVSRRVPPVAAIKEHPAIEVSPPVVAAKPPTVPPRLPSVSASAAPQEPRLPPFV